MHYSLVWSIAGSLQKGQAYVFTKEDIRTASECQLDSAMDTVRRSDIIEFTNNIKEQFDVDLYENPFNGNWTMRN